MMKTHMAACLFGTALLAAPVLAQNAPPPATNTAPVTTPAGPAGSTMGANPNATTTTTTTGAGSGSAAGSAPGTITASGMGANMNFIPRRDQGVMRASELIGKDVYGANNEDIGDVDDVLINANGQVIGVVVGVGGFLGIGETNIAVPMSALQFRPREAARNTGAGTAGTTTGAGSTGSSAGTTAGGTNTAAAAGSGTAGSTAGTVGDGSRPDAVIVLMVTKDQLNTAPKFQDDTRKGAARGSAPATGSGTAPGAAGTAPRQ